MKEKNSLEERLAQYPKLRERVVTLLELVEGDQAEVLKADLVEERVEQELKGLGREALEGWAETQAARQERVWSQRPGVTRKEKKASGG